jgi:trypsin
MPRMKLHSALLTLLVVIIGASAQTEGDTVVDTVVDNIIQALSPSPESTADAETVLRAEAFFSDRSGGAIPSVDVTEYFGDTVIDNDDTLDQSRAMESRIINGVRADPEDYKFLVSLRIGESHYCAGSVVHPQVVVTAAHCIEPIRQKGSDFPLVVTAPNAASHLDPVGTRASVVRGAYNAATHNNDIAVLLLNRPLEGVEPIKMAMPGTRLSRGEQLQIAGWGLLSENSLEISPYLMEATVGFVDNSECNKILGMGKITDNMICAGDLINGRDACQGDSGGPLLAYNSETGEQELLGVVSWGIGCGRIGLPGVYSSVPYFESWITTYMEQWAAEKRLVLVQ